MPKGINAALVGQTFGEWTVLAKDPTKRGYNKVHWLCRCTCGQVRPVQTSNLVKGASTRCRSCSNRATHERRRQAKEVTGTQPTGGS